MVRWHTVLRPVDLEAYEKQRSILTRAIEAIETLAGVDENQDTTTKMYFKDICDQIRTLL